MKIRHVVTPSLLVLLAACGGGGGGSTPTGPDGQSGDHLNYGGQNYSLGAGLEETFDPEDNHSQSQLNFTDGSFYSTQVTLFGSLHLIWRARDAQVWLRGDMYAPGQSGLRAGTYEFRSDDVDENSAALASVYFFNDASLGVDINNDGDIDSDDDEFLAVVGGTITMTESAGGFAVSFSVQLENGVSVSGSYTGLIPKV